MAITRDAMNRLYQTRFSRALRKSPTASYAAQRWWSHTQLEYFKNVCQTIGQPSLSYTANIEPPAVEVPTLGEVVAKLPEYVLAGQRFSDEMAQWCSTSKFLSYTARTDSTGYQDVYAQILKNLRGHPIRMVEIGIGVNDPSVVSGMSADHRPGASLEGWCGYFPGSEVHGADVDRRCLIDTENYKTHFVDQRDPSSLRDLAHKIGGGFDLVVDDGLHTPEANVNVMAAFLPLLNPHGIMVVEDVMTDFEPLWLSASDFLPTHYELAYFPHSVLRQLRGYRGQCGIAVITRN